MSRSTSACPMYVSGPSQTGSLKASWTDSPSDRIPDMIPTPGSKYASANAFQSRRSMSVPILIVDDGSATGICVMSVRRPKPPRRPKM